ncbi:hypothetical protein F7725_006271 [Dissostichus mawsoni]|uniref:Uncharacterized protein n=1 Tax=Dissostichus mawsoni TaxID=36200 RepID=A0A7J5YTU4_DISMA|nr:hypothetical protein F7725_006271 [Dissostichus mawsoni]
MMQITAPRKAREPAPTRTSTNFILCISLCSFLLGLLSCSPPRVTMGTREEERRGSKKQTAGQKRDLCSAWEEQHAPQRKLNTPRKQKPPETQVQKTSSQETLQEVHQHVSPYLIKTEGSQSGKRSC